MALSLNLLNALNSIYITHSFHNPPARLILSSKIKTFTALDLHLKVLNILQRSKSTNSSNSIDSSTSPDLTSTTTPDLTSATTTPISATTNILTCEEDQSTKEDENSRKPASINTIIKNSFVKENDVPWSGEEDLKDTVLRMIVDKYPPLKIKRESIKDYINAHSLKHQYNNSANLSNSFNNLNNYSMTKNTIDSPANKLQNEKKLEKVREKKQSRIMNAREAAIDYTINKKYGDENEQKNEILPKSIEAWDSIVEQRIQEAILAGKFKNLPYHGRPLPLDQNERNPYLDRTEFFMNRLVQRQGSAPAWIESQNDIDREILLFRKRMQESWVRYAKSYNIPMQLRNSKWEKTQYSYYKKVVEKLNSKLRSYNIIAPYSVRKCYINLDQEYERMYKNVNQNEDIKNIETINGTKFDEWLNEVGEKKSKNDGNTIWKGFARNIKWLIGR